MAALTTNVVPHAGLRIDDKFVPAAAGGDDCATGAGVVLLVKNGDASAHTVTLVTPGTVDGLPVQDRAFPVPANSETTIPVLDDLYRNSSTGRASITYDAVTSVTVAVIRVAAS